jgi:hypothetical protein
MIMRLFVDNQGTEKYNSTNQLIQEIVLLEYKFKHSEEQSFYFHQAIDSHKKRLELLKIKYNIIREKINSMEIDDLIQNLKKAENKKLNFLANIEKTNLLNDLNKMALSLMNDNIELINDFIYCKNKYRCLKKIEDVLNNEEYLSEIFKTYRINALTLSLSQR